MNNMKQLPYYIFEDSAFLNVTEEQALKAYELCDKSKYSCFMSFLWNTYIGSNLHNAIEHDQVGFLNSKYLVTYNPLHKVASIIEYKTNKGLIYQRCKGFLYPHHFKYNIPKFIIGIVLEILETKC